MMQHNLGKTNYDQLYLIFLGERKRRENYPNITQLYLIVQTQSYKYYEFH